ncbi:MAG: SDR family NAD(P)-dependent oxidoreductase [Bacteroidota bacterium]
MKKTAFDIIKGQNLKGKVYLVTGAYSGLGAATTEALLKANATVIIGGRSAAKQAEFAQSLKDNTELSFDEQQLDASYTIDLGNLESVRDFANYVNDKYDQIDALINNAGVMYTPPGKTKDGFETQMGINVIGHFLLSKILAPKTNRQVWLSSRAHIRFGSPNIDYKAITEVDESTYNTRLCYQQSKLGNILLAKQFSIEYPHMVAYSVHPGFVGTNLGRHAKPSQVLWLLLKNPLLPFQRQTPEQGAATQVMVAILPEDQLTSGAYYADCKVTKETDSAKNMADAKKLFEYCEEVTAKFQS